MDKVDKVEVSDVVEQVSKDAYTKVSADMHKFKQESKALAQKLADIQAEQEAKDKASMEEKEQWHDLYKKSELKLKSFEAERATEKSKFIDSHKVNAVIQDLGGFKKTEYNKFIDTSKIEVKEDGSIDESSVSLEVDRIRKEFPELLKAKQINPLPSNAPVGFGTKTVAQMSQAERDEAKRELLKRK